MESCEVKDGETRFEKDMLKRCIILQTNASVTHFCTRTAGGFGFGSQFEIHDLSRLEGTK